MTLRPFSAFTVRPGLSHDGLLALADLSPMARTPERSAVIHSSVGCIDTPACPAMELSRKAKG
jgi:hypothetical protein